MSLIKNFCMFKLIEKQFASMSDMLAGALSHMAAVVSLFVLCAQLLLLFLASLVWLAYTLLVGQGFAPEQAGGMISACILIMLACGIFTIRRAFQDMQDSLAFQRRQKPSISHNITRITDSFINGLTSDSSQVRKL